MSEEFKDELDYCWKSTDGFPKCKYLLDCVPADCELGFDSDYIEDFSAIARSNDCKEEFPVKSKKEIEWKVDK